MERFLSCGELLDFISREMHLFEWVETNDSDLAHASYMSYAALKEILEAAKFCFDGRVAITKDEFVAFLNRYSKRSDAQDAIASLLYKLENA